jgi:hypothetical protein
MMRKTRRAEVFMFCFLVVVDVDADKIQVMENKEIFGSFIGAVVELDLMRNLKFFLR